MLCDTKVTCFFPHNMYRNFSNKIFNATILITSVVWRSPARRAHYSVKSTTKILPGATVPSDARSTHEKNVC